MRRATILTAVMMLGGKAAVAQYYPPNCGAVPNCPNGTNCVPPQQPAVAPPTQPALMMVPAGQYVQAPATGEYEGESQGLGVRGFGLRIPEMNLQLPTLQLPSLVHFRRDATMHVAPSQAPYVPGVAAQYGMLSAGGQMPAITSAPLTSSPATSPCQGQEQPAEQDQPPCAPPADLPCTMTPQIQQLQAQMQQLQQRLQQLTELQRQRAVQQAAAKDATAPEAPGGQQPAVRAVSLGGRGPGQVVAQQQSVAAEVAACEQEFLAVCERMKAEQQATAKNVVKAGDGHALPSTNAQTDRQQTNTAPKSAAPNTRENPPVKRPLLARFLRWGE